MPITIDLKLEDISLAKTDVIVNPTDKFFTRTLGINSKLYDAAGNGLSAYLKDLGEQEEGSSVMTPAYNLACGKIIHLIGPSPGKSTKEASTILREGYRNVFRLVKQNGFHSVALSEPGDSIYGLYYEEKLQVMVEELRDFLAGNSFGGKIEIYCRARKGFSSLSILLQGDSAMQPFVLDLIKTFRSKQARLTKSLADALSKEEMLNRELKTAYNEISKQKEEISVQHDLIENAFLDWKGNYDQTDDILVNWSKAKIILTFVHALFKFDSTKHQGVEF